MLIDKSKENLVKSPEDIKGDDKMKDDITSRMYMTVEILYNLCFYEKKKVFVFFN
jgi:hypothetical protein